MTVFMERLQSLMDERNLNDTDLRETLGLSRNAITNWRNGMRPQASTVHRLAEFFNVSYDYLRGIDELKAEANEILDKTSSNAMITELMRMYKECETQSQIYIAKIIWEEWMRSKNEKPSD